MAEQAEQVERAPDEVVVFIGGQGDLLARLTAAQAQMNQLPEVEELGTTVTIEVTARRAMVIGLRALEAPALPVPPAPRRQPPPPSPSEVPPQSPDAEDWDTDPDSPEPLAADDGFDPFAAVGVPTQMGKKLVYTAAPPRGDTPGAQVHAYYLARGWWRALMVEAGIRDVVYFSPPEANDIPLPLHITGAGDIISSPAPQGYVHLIPPSLCK